MGGDERRISPGGKVIYLVSLNASLSVSLLFHSSVTGKTLASTHSGGSSLARRVNHQRLSNLHCLFMREITFVFPVKMKGGENKEVAN